MLQELKMRLKLMSADPDDPFFAMLRRRVGASEAAYYEQSLRNLILVMPEMLAQIRNWIEVPGMSARTRRLHGFVLSYLFHPRDIIPEDQDGLFGYLDDAFLVALTFEWISGERRSLVDGVPIERGLSEQLPEWLRHVREVIPRESVWVEGMWRELLAGKTTSFDAVMGASA